MANRSEDLSRYELFGWDYEAINPLGKDELGWYHHWAEQADGSILGLACGSARLLIALARQGRSVTGMDLSETMLGIARGHIASEPESVQRRIRLLRQDMEQFDLTERFGLVLIPDNSFRELSTRRQLRRCLQTIHRHLRPRGRLLIAERRFQPELYPDGCRDFGWSSAKPNPRTGELVRRRGHIRLHRDHRRLSGVFEYEVAHDDDHRQTVRCPWSAPVLQLEEYLALFLQAGFTTQVFTDYAVEPDVGGGALWCFVCSRP